ncbi:MAG: glycosyltransferase family 4 protein [bacterium]|nr:MAG: glycosyltransferase family 4 protein [bacterium]
MLIKSSKRFLFVTYYYPPAGGPAVQRIIRIIQYLAEKGWQSVVLTVRNGEYTSLDPKLEEVIPAGTQVIRADIFEPYKLYRKFIGKKDTDKIPLAVLSSHDNVSWKEKIANTIRANLFIPDARIGWYNYGVKAGVRAVQKDPAIRLILSSGPPHTVHLIANSIAKKSGLPLVADFRDPWLNIDYYHNIYRSPLTLAMDKFFEKKILSSADAVSVVSPGCLDLLISHHKNIDNKNFHIIYNGFDPEVYPSKLPLPPDDKFIITYIGNLPLSRYTPKLYEAIFNLKYEKKITPDRFQFHFYGNVDNSARQELSKLQLEDYLYFHHFIPHQEAILNICQSHLLLLIINNTHTQKAIVTGKLFEYLGSRRPILCIGPTDGDAAKILWETQSGNVFDYGDLDGMKNFLWEHYQSWEKCKWQEIGNNNIEKYNRAEQLKKLKHIFESL